MDISQKRFANRATFGFGDSELRYTVRDASGSNTVTVPYAEIERGQDEMVERNAWLRNAGIFWICLSLLIVAASDTTPRRLRGVGWMIIGLGCLIAYRFRTTTFTVLHSSKGRLFVIRNDATHDQILDAIDSRRRSQRREWYAHVDLENAPARETAKFDWLKAEGVISDAEHADAVAAIDGHHHGPAEPLPGSTRLH